ncbi:glutamate-cysteine ligase family protein [Roseofilum capinflatum]|uniref:Glutamate-cysteine ligase family protein n=1 Tax=Roseofilum capinflatum BLCC-M114 TaxID=3022440 RepID=A0ABT7BDC0_9CYAN|nr:glutamate-cysteine ligase family protein [Roseofilum capinflatum]MDJ1176288.1 glutamate-cysteine ligase family protein [Roseofilum capinflatum BLCC-M114]
MNVLNRRLGLEQEFFLVNEEGVLSNQADELLETCAEIALRNGSTPEAFAPEWVKTMIEIKTIPCHHLPELIQEYLKTLNIALKAAKKLHLRLYPLSTYPLHATSLRRDELKYNFQVRTIGSERFEHAAQCTGTHLHLELPPGTVDRRVGCSYNSSPEARAELVNIYNLLTALDPAIISLSRACPFYGGRVSGVAMRTIHYRGSKYYGWEGVYTHLETVGGLTPYVESIEDLVEQQFNRYYCWLKAMEKAGISKAMFAQTGGELLTTGWNPVRMNRLGTVELRGIDSNYPEVILELITLVVHAAKRVQNEGITVRPQSGLEQFELKDSELFVPDFESLNGKLFYQAVTEGIKSSAIKNYLDSILAFAVPSRELSEFKISLGEYQTTEQKLLQNFAPTTAELSRSEALEIVRYCCDQLEAQVARLLS